MANPHEAFFRDTVECPRCCAVNWSPADDGMTCGRCGFFAATKGRMISLLPDHLSANNAREADAYGTEAEPMDPELYEFLINKPYNYPKIAQDEYMAGAKLLRQMAADLGPSPSILFVFGGGGMEAHLAGLLGPNVVLADISSSLLELAEKRYDHYKVAQPGAFVTCDAEKLPFRSGSFDLVVGYEGIHHCLVPQAALQEIWRVSRKRTFIVDNLECALTRFMHFFGRSSMVETSGVKPNRFTRIAVETMLFNAKLDSYVMKPHMSIPYWAIKYLGTFGGRLISRFLTSIGQTNMFMLATDRNGRLPI